MHLGHKILAEEKVSVPKHRIKPKERPGEKYEVSRWSPLLQDIAEVSLVGHTLSSCYCPAILAWRSVYKYIHCVYVVG